MAATLEERPARKSNANRRPRKAQGKRKAARPKQLSRLQKPEDMTLEEWQLALRRQFGRQQEFQLRNTGEHPIFSEFQVTNPESKNTYRVCIRGPQPRDNYCSCPDFATGNLGTCKHIEFALSRLEKKRGGAAALRAGYQPPYSEIYLQYGARREVRFRPGSDCPRELARLAAKYFDADGALTSEGFAEFDALLAKAGKTEHELRCFDDARGFIAQVRDAEHRRRRLAEAFPRGIRSAAFKNLLKVPLYEYQRYGALFAAGAGRALIGDEMGLGKTIQAIAAAEIVARLFGVERVLVVCPTSLKHQWQKEIERFTDRTVQVIGGLKPERDRRFATPTFFKIINYDTIHRDLDAIQEWSPDLVILDEAQRIKNWNTRAARSVKKVESPYAVVLTGTPLENRLEELVSLVQFVDRHRLGPTYRFLHDHQMKDESGRVVGYRDLDHIARTLEPILLRRQKSQVLSQLPGRLDKQFFVPMTPQQMTLHEEHREIVAKIVAKWRRYKFLSEADQQRLMIALQCMRMSADSTYLVDHVSDFGVKADELATLLEEIFEEPDSKVVIFSQWLRMHELLERRFAARDWNDRYVLFHGGVPGEKRSDLVERFRNEDACRAFLATDAGGVGLNLQHASVVVNVDLPWNPAILEQRIGRVHRLGQKQPVRVVNFVSQGSIEEGMLGVLKFKKSLFAGVLDGGESQVFLGGTRLTQFMETVEKTSGSIPTAETEERAEGEERGAGDGAMRGGPADERTAGGSGEDRNGEAAPSGERNGDGGTTIAPADPWAGLLQTGLGLLQQLAAAARPQPADGRSPRSSSAEGLASSMIRRDEATGEAYLRLPVPPPEALEQALDAFASLLQGMRR